jgi:hypothetical protein
MTILLVKFFECDEVMGRWRWRCTIMVLSDGQVFLVEKQ